VVDSSTTRSAISRAIAALRAGKVIGLPTETVYGLAAKATDPRAVAAIFEMKRRPADRALTIHMGPALDPLAFAEPVDGWERLAELWPGPLTLVLPARSHVPRSVTAGRPTVGLRVPDDPLAAKVLNDLPEGVVATSANISGHPAVSTAAQARAIFGDALAEALPESSTSGRASTVVSLVGEPMVLRQGDIPRAVLEQRLGRPIGILGG